MFEGEPGPKPRVPSTRTLRRRLIEAAIGWYLNDIEPEEVLFAARDLHKARKS